MTEEIVELYFYHKANSPSGTPPDKLYIKESAWKELCKYAGRHHNLSTSFDKLPKYFYGMKAEFIDEEGEINFYVEGES